MNARFLSLWIISAVAVHAATVGARYTGIGTNRPANLSNAYTVVVTDGSHVRVSVQSTIKADSWISADGSPGSPQTLQWLKAGYWKKADGTIIGTVAFTDTGSKAFQSQESYSESTIFGPLSVPAGAVALRCHAQLSASGNASSDFYTDVEFTAYRKVTLTGVNPTGSPQMMGLQDVADPAYTFYLRQVPAGGTYTQDISLASGDDRSFRVVVEDVAATWDGSHVVHAFSDEAGGTYYGGVVATPLDGTSKSYSDGADGDPGASTPTATGTTGNKFSSTPGTVVLPPTNLDIATGAVGRSTTTNGGLIAGSTNSLNIGAYNGGVNAITDAIEKLEKTVRATSGTGGGGSDMTVTNGKIDVTNGKLDVVHTDLQAVQSKLDVLDQVASEQETAKAENPSASSVASQSETAKENVRGAFDGLYGSSTQEVPGGTNLGQSPNWILHLGSMTLDFTPSSNLLNFMQWIKAFWAWALAAWFANWTYQHFLKISIGVGGVPQIRGHDAIGGTGAQATALVNVAGWTAMILGLPGALAALYATAGIDMPLFHFVSDPLSSLTLLGGSAGYVAFAVNHMVPWPNVLICFLGPPVVTALTIPIYMGVVSLVKWLIA